MSDSDLKDREETSADELDKEHSDDFSDEEKSRLEELSGQMDGNKESEEAGEGEEDPEIPYREEKSRTNRLRRRITKKRAAIGAGITTSVIVGIMSFLALLPLKINHIVDNLEKKFFASSESAVSRRTERLFSDYVKKKVLPGLGPGCSSTLANKSCALVDPGKSKLANLYNGWRDANLEGKLASKYGIEFERKGNDTYLMKIDGNETNISDLKTGKANELRDIQAVGRSDVRAKWMGALEDESKFTKVLYRFKVGRLLERKYGIKRCLFACDLKDGIANWKDNKAKGAKALFAERILTPRSGYLGLLFECMINSGCNPDTASSRDGEKRDVFQQRLDAKIAEYASSFGTKEAGDAAIKKLIDESDQLLANGYRKYIIEKIFKEEAATSINEAADKALPVIGWINTIASLVGKASKFGGQYRRWVYITNATAMVGTYMMYRTQADELKSGNVDLQLLGTMAETLGQNASDNHKGQSAEVSPLYNNLLGDDSASGKQSALYQLLNPQVDAQASSPDPTDPTPYTCDNGSPPEKGKFICPEESLTTHNAVTDFSDALNQSPLDSVTTVANFWNGTAGKVLGFLSNLAGSVLSFALDHTPGYNEAAAYAGKLIDPLLKKVADVLIPDPFSDMSGARAFNMAAGGADVSGNYFAHFGLGSKMLTPTQSLTIQNQRAEDERLQFSHQPLMARLFDKEAPDSLVSQFAMTLPTDTSFFSVSLANLTNPFSTVLKMSGTLLGGKKVSAQSTASEDPFGISQYGYPLDDPSLTNDPEIYTDDYCANMDKNWADAGQFENPDTGVFENTATNPCRLESDAITSAGALFTDSVLGPNDTSFSPGE